MFLSLFWRGSLRVRVKENFSKEELVIYQVRVLTQALKAKHLKPKVLCAVFLPRTVTPVHCFALH